jgi:hypothetical protein
MTIRLCPLYDLVKARALHMLENDCPNHHTVEELRSTDNIWLVRNTVAVALCIARNAIAPQVGVRPHFNKGNFRQATAEIIRQVRRC